MKDIKVLSWDTNFFGYKIARYMSQEIEKEQISNLNLHAREEGIKCLYFLASLTCHETTLLLEKNQFHLMDIRVTLSKNIQKNDMKYKLEFASEKDVIEIQRISKGAYVFSRFYFDSLLRDKAALFFDVWIENSLKGWADCNLILKVNNKIGAFLTAHVAGEELNIGLVGVSKECRGQGLGHQVLEMLESWAIDKKIKKINVTTQARNVSAMRLYEKAGYRVVDTKAWYHKWF